MFKAGWTDYSKRAYYNAFDVTSYLNTGINAVGVILADGWYSGYLGFGKLLGLGTNGTGRDTYGKSPALLLQLLVETVDGVHLTFATDNSWKVTSNGPVREADLLMGERYDASKEILGWSQPDFDDNCWDFAILARELCSLHCKLP